MFMALKNRKAAHKATALGADDAGAETGQLLSKPALLRLQHLISSLLQERYDEVLAGEDDMARSLVPLVQHLRDKNIAALTALADIWVEQTVPLLAVANMKADMQTLGERTQSVADAVSELTSSIGEIGRATDEVAREAVEVHDKVADSANAADQAVSSIGRSAEAVSDLGHKVDALNGSIEQISGIIKAIDAIARQTNLLALNATIEAARAGEAGRGFAVVAGEVKALSNQTAQATEDIRQRIAHLQQGMQDIVVAMHQSGETVESGSVSVRDAGAMIKTINATVDAVSRNMGTIAEVVQQQMSATNEVEASVSATATMSSDALAAIERLARAVDRVGEVVQPRLQEYAKHLNDRTLVQLARSDHATFKKRVIDTLVGRAQAKSCDLPDHHGCRFGKWYDGLQDQDLKDSAAYRRIEEPHLRVHACGKEALAKFQEGDFDAAVAAAGEMEKASVDVFSALDEMSRLLAARESNK
jgi:methyl-accepting chemotaxis protein